jgi:amidase
VAGGLVSLATGGDGGGSIRIPASECGLVGLKPSRGRHSLGPELGEAWAGFVSRLVVSRSVRDTATVLDAVHGWMPGDPYTAPAPARPYVEELVSDPPPLRVGFLTAAADPSVAVHPACEAAVLDTLRQLESLGHRVADDRPEALADAGAVAEFTAQFINLYATWVATDLDELGRLSGAPVGPAGVEAGTWTLGEMGRAVSGVQYLEALVFCHRFTRRVAAWWADGFDILVTPTIPEPPPELGAFRATADDPLRGLLRSAALVQFTAPFNATGQPAISLPLGWHDGLPVGVQLVAPYGREDLLLALAAQLERAAPWAHHRPPVHA